MDWLSKMIIKDQLQRKLDREGFINCSLLIADEIEVFSEMCQAKENYKNAEKYRNSLKENK